jgi:hypothetical protein
MDKTEKMANVPTPTWNTRKPNPTVQSKMHLPKMNAMAEL